MKLILILTFLGLGLIGALATGPGWYDSGELAIGPALLAVTHPPGQPTFNLLALGFTLTPLATLYFRVALASLVFGLIALGLGSLTLNQLNQETTHLPNQRAWSVLLLLTMISLPAFAYQASRVELYTLSLLLFMTVAALWLAYIRTPDFRYLGTLYLALALLCMTHTLIGFMTLVPIAALTLYHARQWQIRPAPHLLVFFVIGLLITLYLPLRAVTHPELNWGQVDDWRRFLHFILAKDYAGSLSWHSSITTLLQSPLHCLLLMTALTGLIKSFFRLQRQPHIWSEFSLWLLACAQLFMWLLLPLALNNPDVHGYLLPSYALLLILAFHYVQRVCHSCSQLKSSYALALTATVVIAASSHHQTWRAWQAHGSPAIHILMNISRALSAQSTLVVASDHWAFPLWYRQHIEHRDHHINVLVEGFVRTSWYREQHHHNLHQAQIDRTWYEHARDESLPVTRQLTDTEFSHIHESFGQYCQTRSDPFDIEASLCGQIATQWIKQWIAQQRFGSALAFLNTYFATNYPVECPVLKSIQAPFPLMSEPDEQDHIFLPSKDQVVFTWMWLLASCDQSNHARTQYIAGTQSMNMHLLYTFLLLQHQGPENALEHLQSINLNRGSLNPIRRTANKKKGYQHLALSTLYLMQQNLQQSQQHLKQAQQQLGSSSEPVKRLHLLLDAQKRLTRQP